MSNMVQIGFVNEMALWGLGTTASSVMTECEKYGMCYGCDIHCPVLQRGECECEDNKELYQKYLEEYE